MIIENKSKQQQHTTYNIQHTKTTTEKHLKMTTSTTLTTKDVNIPNNATLLLKRQDSSDHTPSLIAISSGASIPISPLTSSINQSKQFLLLGRQANVSDIRINHKSISRKHAVLYFDAGKGTNTSDTDDSTSDAVLILKDLGGKFGCTVNGTRLEKNGNVILKHGDMVMFGNVRDQIFKVSCPEDIQLLNMEEEEEDQRKEIVNEKEKEVEVEGNDHNENSSEKLEEQMRIQRNEKDEVEKTILTGRAAREAEIAAMMDSLDQEPVYTKFKSGPDSKPKTNTNENINHNVKTSIISTTSKSNQFDKRIPITQSITIPNINNTSMLPSSSSSSLVTTLSLDPSGSRLLAGMSNGTIRLYDFNGMDLSLQPFRTISVQESRYTVVSTTFSSSGDRIMVGTTSAQPVILDRDGYEIIEFAKGDMYVTDMVHTDGHVANITGIDCTLY